MKKTQKCAIAAIEDYPSKPKNDGLQNNNR
jgi:hypothetical protein